VRAVGVLLPDHALLVERLRISPCQDLCPECRLRTRNQVIDGWGISPGSWFKPHVIHRLTTGIVLQSPQRLPGQNIRTTTYCSGGSMFPAQCGHRRRYGCAERIESRKADTAAYRAAISAQAGAKRGVFGNRLREKATPALHTRQAGHLLERSARPHRTYTAVGYVLRLCDVQRDPARDGEDRSLVSA
jgi:hypothetical protein